MTPRRREIFLALAFALWGLAISIALVDVFARPPRPDQLPGLAKNMSIDAHAPMRFFLTLIVITIALPVLLRPIARRLATAETWAYRTAMFACVGALWYVQVTRTIAWVIVPAAITIAACVVLRNFRAEF
ncbi:MAG TPA: hypothetical protein VMU84_09985, partial [Thermoanaerobaculia bacterium]|nr:hypothetical protein [Thermoanaerobaculia bacterium]